MEAINLHCPHTYGDTHQRGSGAGGGACCGFSCPAAGAAFCAAGAVASPAADAGGLGAARLTGATGVPSGFSTCFSDTVFVFGFGTAAGSAPVTGVPVITPVPGATGFLRGGVVPAAPDAVAVAAGSAAAGLLTFLAAGGVAPAAGLPV